MAKANHVGKAETDTTAPLFVLMLLSGSRLKFIISSNIIS